MTAKITTTADVSWGTFLKDTSGKKKLQKPHVAPINEDGFLLTPHELSIKCVCRPFRSVEGYVVHNHPLTTVN